MTRKATVISAVAAVALAAAPLTSASAHERFHHGGGLIFGLAALGAAAVVGAVTLATAPVRVLAAPAYAPPPAYYPPPPAYYYAPAPTYYAPAPGYYYGR
jgi:hypothetical protein